MKKLLLILAFFTIFTLQTNAATFKAWEELNITQNISWDFYGAWWRVQVDSDIDGDLIIAWWELNINWDISEDLIIAWWDIVISWNVWDDIRVAWWNVRIEWNVDWDLVVAWWNIEIKKEVLINWDLLASWWRIILDWEVMWNALVKSWEFVLNWVIQNNLDLTTEKFSNTTWSWRIFWNTNYKSQKRIESLENSTNWETSFKEIKDVKKEILWFLSFYLIVKLIWIFVFSSLLFLFFQKWFASISNILREKTGKSFVHGLLVFGWMPIIIILLFISIIWIPLWIFWIFLYIFLFVFLEIINSVVLTSLIVNKYNIEKTYQKMLILLWFCLLFWLINWIDLIVWLFTVWAIMVKKIEIIWSFRK